MVDKIYDDKGKLIAEYFYDNDNRLIKKIVTDDVGIARRWVDEFEYENGRITKIKHDDQTYSFDWEANINYNSLGQLISKEVFVKGVSIEVVNYHYKDGKVVSIYNSESEPFEFDTLFYDNNGNVITHSYIIPIKECDGCPILGYKHVENKYEYDNKPLPNFGIDYLFVYDPMPYTDAPEIEKKISKNNMIKAVSEKYSYFYTYNEIGLPITFETKWDEIITDPTILNITYKSKNQNTSIIDKDKNQIIIYPNPARDKLFLNSIDADLIKIYDINGKEVYSGIFDLFSEIDISRLSNGNYLVCLFAGEKLISMESIVKK